MNAQIGLAVRRVLAAVVAFVAVAVAAEIPVHAHRYSQCLDVTGMGCGHWVYSGTPYWAIAVAVPIGLLGLVLAALVYQPRHLGR